MKLPKNITKVEVWSHTLFFIQDGTWTDSMGRGQTHDGISKIFECVDRITPLMGEFDKDGKRGCWWEMTPEEFEAITEGVDCEMPKRNS